jgi:hypothetical protein
MKIINLTQHNMTPDQIGDGAVEPSPEVKQRIAALLTFAALPEPAEIEMRAAQIAQIAVEQGATAAVCGGAPYLMGALELALEAYGIKPLYSFTERRSVEETLPDGSVKKSQVFAHVGWVEVKPFGLIAKLAS